MGRQRRSLRDYKALFAAFERSDLSLYAFARKEGVPYSTMDRWKRRLAAKEKTEVASPSPRFLPVTVGPVLPGPETSRRDSCEVRLRNGHELRVPPGFDPATLSALISTLESSSCSR